MSNMLENNAAANWTYIANIVGFILCLFFFENYNYVFMLRKLIILIFLILAFMYIYIN